MKANKVEVSLYSLIDPSTNPKSVKEFLADKNLSDGELRGIEAALVNGSAEEKQALMGRYFPHGLPQPQRTGSGELVYGKIGPWWQFWSSRGAVGPFLLRVRGDDRDRPGPRQFRPKCL